MTRARDIADSGAIINHLDDVSSDIQTQIDATEAATTAAQAAATAAQAGATAATAAATAAQAAVSDTAVAMAIALGG